MKKVSQWFGRPAMVEKSSDLRRTCDTTRAITFFVAVRWTVEKCFPLLKEISYDRIYDEIDYSDI